MNEWISIEDSLPDNEVVIITNGKDVRPGWYFKDYKEWRHWNGEGMLKNKYHVTHWMHLPEPPVS